MGLLAVFLYFALLLVWFLPYCTSCCFWILTSIYKWLFGVDERTTAPSAAVPGLMWPVHFRLLAQSQNSQVLAAKRWRQWRWPCGAISCLRLVHCRYTQNPPAHQLWRPWDLRHYCSALCTDPRNCHAEEDIGLCCVALKGWHFPQRPTWEQQLVSLSSLPGRQKLNELVCLLVCFSSCVHVFYLLGHLGEVPTAASQADAGGGGAGAEPRVWHRWRLVLPQEVKAAWWRGKSRWSVLGRAHAGGSHTAVCSYLFFRRKHLILAMAMINETRILSLFME